MKDIVTIGQTNWRNSNIPFGIKAKDRLQHMYVIGKTGVGKSTLLLNILIQDINYGRGIMVIDPHGDIAENIIDAIPPNRLQDVLYIAPFDDSFTIAFNPLYNVPYESHHLAVSGIISAFKKAWAESWGPRMEHILRFSLFALLAYNKGTLLDIQPLLTNESFRTTVLSKVKDTSILNFWYGEFSKYTPAFRNEAIAPILNKLSIFAACKPLRQCIGHPTRSFSLYAAMNEQKIIVCNLSKGKLGEDASGLLGSLLITSIQVAALQRASMPENERVPFFLFIDEMQSFITLSFVDMLSEARKYGLGLFLTHQFIEQIDNKIFAAIIGNVGTLISFRIGSTDAEVFAKEFYPVFTQTDFIDLPRYSIYLKLMIDGMSSKPFSAQTVLLHSQSMASKVRVLDYMKLTYPFVAITNNKTAYRLGATLFEN